MGNEGTVNLRIEGDCEVWREGETASGCNNVRGRINIEKNKIISPSQNDLCWHFFSTQEFMVESKYSMEYDNPNISLSGYFFVKYVSQFQHLGILKYTSFYNNQ